MPLHHSENIDVEIQTAVITCSFRDVPLMERHLFLPSSYHEIHLLYDVWLHLAVERYSPQIAFVPSLHAEGRVFDCAWQYLTFYHHHHLFCPS